jgi:hypothetical protein
MRYPITNQIVLGFQSEELNEFEGLASDYDDWYKEEEEYVRENAKDWWPEWDELSPEEQRERIQEQMSEQEDGMSDNTTLFFRDPKPMPPESWLVHFTPSDPLKILKEGMKGCDPSNMGLTTHQSCAPGDLSFAFDINTVKGPEDQFGDYGENAILFRAGESIKVRHISDNDPEQVIFDIPSVDLAIPLIAVDKAFEVWSREGKFLFKVKATRGCFKKIIDELAKHPGQYPAQEF